MLVELTIRPVSELLQTPSPTPTLNNTLVNSGSQDIVYIGTFLLAITIVIIIGLLNKKIEYALIFASILSVILIILLWFL